MAIFVVEMDGALTSQQILIFQQSLEESDIRADNIDPNFISICLPLKQGEMGKVKMKLFQFKGYITYRKAGNKMVSAGFKPANAQHMMAFVRQYPQEVVEASKIFALGHLWCRFDESSLYFPVSAGLKVGWADPDSLIGSDCWFLGVRKYT